MIPGLYSRPSVQIGLAVHHDHLCMVSLRFTPTQIVIESGSTLPLTAGDLGNTLRQERLTHTKKSCEAVLALPAARVLNKRIRVAACLNEEERFAEIRSNLDAWLPEVQEPLYFDFIALACHETEMELQLTAARVSEVDRWIELLKTAGLKTKVVDIDVHAIARGIHGLSGKHQAETQLILNRDGLSAQLMLSKRGRVLSLYPLLMESDDVFSQQIKTGLQIFSGMEPQNPLDKIWLTGCQPDNQDDLKTFLESELSMTVQTPMFPAHVAFHPTLDSQQFHASLSERMAAFGLALRGASYA